MNIQAKGLGLVSIALLIAGCLLVCTTNAAGESIMIGPSAFTPTNEITKYDHFGAFISPVGSGVAYFSAPVTVPANSTITKIRFYAVDKSLDPGEQVCVYLKVSTPTSAGSGGYYGTTLGSACSTDSTTVQTFTFTPSANTITANQYVYLWISMYAISSTLEFYGVKVTYSP